MRKGEQWDINALKPFNERRLKAVISGTIGNVQNLDGINYFLNELYPCVPKDMDVVIAGKNPPAELIERLKRFGNIELIANPKDMDAVLRDCDIFLCPTRLGGGMKLRVMDGLRNGLPVIAHKVSARGYGEFEKKGILIRFNTEEQFEQAIIQATTAIKDKYFSKRYIVEQCFIISFEYNLNVLKEIFNICFVR